MKKSLEQLSQINATLIQFKVYQQDERGETMPFGGISIILKENFSQLPPVKDKPLYIDPGKKNLQHSKGSHLYKIFNKAIVLKQIMRQQGHEEKEFRKVLTNLSSGNFTEEDWKWLQLRDLKQMTQEEQESFFQQGIKLCAFNKDAIGYNTLKIRELGQPIALIRAVNNNHFAKMASISDAGDLPKESLLVEGAGMILKTNL